MQSVGFNMLIDSVNKEVQLIKKGMQLDLGGIGQGYIGQKVMDYLFKQNIYSTLVDVSGDIVT